MPRGLCLGSLMARLHFPSLSVGPLIIKFPLEPILDPYSLDTHDKCLSLITMLNASGTRIQLYLDVGG